MMHAETCMSWCNYCMVFSFLCMPFSSDGVGNPGMDVNIGGHTVVV